MCQLSHVDIEREVDDKNLIIAPFDPALLRPNSYDWRLSTTIFEAQCEPNTWRTWKLKLGELFLFQPGHFYLCSTMERIELPNNITCRLEGRSSVARLGMSVHLTAGHIDVGYPGHLTAEVKLGPWPVTLEIGQNIGQFVFEYVRTPAVLGYKDFPGSKYMDQPDTPVPSRLAWEGIHDRTDSRREAKASSTVVRHPVTGPVS